MPRSATVRVGSPGRTLPMSAISIASERNSSGWAGGIGVERAADLLLALDHELDPDRGPALPRAQRADVRDHVRLGVGAAAAEHRAVALGRLERRGLPLRLVAGRRRRRSGRRAARSALPVEPGSRRCTKGAVFGRRCDRLLDACSLSSSRTARAPPERRPRFRRVVRGGDRRDRDEPLEVFLQPRHQPLTRSAGATGVPSSRISSFRGGAPRRGTFPYPAGRGADVIPGSGRRLLWRGAVLTVVGNRPDLWKSCRGSMSICEGRKRRARRLSLSVRHSGAMRSVEPRCAIAHLGNS